MYAWLYTALELRYLIFNKLGRDESGSAKAYLGSGGALSAEIPLQCVDGRVQNQMAIGTSLQMALDLAFDGRRESPL